MIGRGAATAKGRGSATPRERAWPGARLYEERPREALRLAWRECDGIVLFLAAGAAAIAIERDPESCARVRNNAASHGTYVRVIEGEAPGALRDLAEPDAVFIGGSGGGFDEIVKLCALRARRSVVLSLITLERVVPAAEILEGCGLEVETTFLQASRVRGVGSLHRLVPEAPVFVVSGRKK